MRVWILFHWVIGLLVIGHFPARAESESACAEISKFDLGHSSISFLVPISEGLSEVVGQIRPSRIDLRWCASDPARSALRVELDMNTIDTGIPDRDLDLRGEAFFDAGKFPTAAFVSSSIQALGGSNYRLAGELTFHGVSRTIEVTAELKQQRSSDGLVLALHTDFQIDRDDWSVDWRHPVDGFVGDQVSIRVRLLSRLLDPSTLPDTP